MCTDKVVPGAGAGPGLAPEPFSMSSPSPCPVTSLHMVFLTARLISESYISGVHSLTTTFQVADIILLCLSVPN